MAHPKAWLSSLVLGLCATLGACTDPGFYTDHREGISSFGGNAVASNIAVQTIDPWPPHSSDRHQPADGERTQKAIERYRTNKVTSPQGTSTSSVQFTPVLAAPSAAPSGSGQ
jgi:type IV pilus biogenesis protein CpaD/CtpE